jgi:type VI secretion system protein ImpA
MATPAVLDFDRLLAPIPGDDPAGADLRADASPNSPYYLVKDARTAARAAERQVVADGEDAGARPDWRPVLRHGLAALERAKDLEVAAFVTESLVRLNGFAGLRDGFHLTRGLVELFWDGLHPRPDEDGLATRVSPLTSLNGDDADGTLIQPIAAVPLTSGSGSFGHGHYQQALALEQVTDEDARNRRLQQGAVPLEKVRRAVIETPAPFYADLLADLDGCREQFAGLCAALDERCNGECPPASNIRSALDACRDAVTELARDKLVPPAPASDGETPAEPADDGTAPTATALRSRDDAFQTLLRVADYFRSAEPHNPVSYALEQAVRWGRMALPELLAELIDDEKSRFSLFKQVGIRAPVNAE